MRYYLVKMNLFLLWGEQEILLPLVKNAETNTVRYALWYSDKQAKAESFLIINFKS